jgi:hypothetical protein
MIRLEVEGLHGVILDVYVNAFFPDVSSAREKRSEKFPAKW